MLRLLIPPLFQKSTFYNKQVFVSVDEENIFGTRTFLIKLAGLSLRNSLSLAPRCGTLAGLSLDNSPSPAI